MPSIKYSHEIPFIKTKTSNHIGVDYHMLSKKWRARIYFDSKQITIGFYKLEKEAFVARKAANKIKQKVLCMQHNNTKLLSKEVDL